MEQERRFMSLEQRMEKLERGHEKLDDRLDIVEKEQTETKVYVKQIFSILEELKMTIRAGITKEDLFSFLSNQKTVELEAADRERQAADRQDERSNNTKTLETWQKTVLAILSGTIFVIVGYFFGAK